MQTGTAEFLESFTSARYRFFESRTHAGVIKKLLLALGMALLTGLSAQIRIPLPWSPVPITGQTFAAILSGVLLGRWWGGASMIVYLALGLAGVPWFNGFSGGMGHLVGPTGGYLIGFVVASLFIGDMTDRYVRARSFTAMLVLMLIANFLIIHVLGLVQLGLWLNLVKGSPVSLGELLWLGTIPFIPGDVTKTVLAALIARGITPKEAYNGEADAAKWHSWRLP
ncbi:MAG: biotin transporter BioY [Chloroflexota bacterium]